MENYKKIIKELQKLYQEDDICPFPYDDLRELRNELENEFGRFAQDESINADLNTYFSYVSGLASGGVEKYLFDVVERHRMKQWVSKSFFEWFPKYRFLEKYELSDFEALDRDLKLHDKMRSMIQDIISLYEEKHYGIRI
ncbi:MAG TPA: YxiJ family protein [Clostridia bacterium]